jgi:hypothetical protein
VNPYRYGGIGAPGRYRFTDFSRLAGPGINLLYADNSNHKYTSLEVRDCAFMGGNCHFECGPDCAVGLTNNLFETQILWAGGDFPFAAYNNLFRRGIVALECGSATPWPVRDNTFDSGYMEDMFGNIGVAHDHNAFINEAVALMATDPTDMILTSFAYVPGPLGNYYQPATSPLIDQGSRTADLASLYHYTTQTNQVKEANSPVDIGFHYVAVDANSIPIDTDHDGVPDYLEDGNGADDPTSWLIYNSPNGLTGGNGLQVYTPLK